MSSASVTTSDGQVIVTRDDDDGMVTGPATESHAATPIIVRDGHLVSRPESFTVGVHSDRPLDGASFIAGLMLGMLVLFIIQRAMRFYTRRDAKAHARAAAIGPQGEDRMAAEVAALARRTATLETIVTDPAHRTAREIEALR